MFDVSLLQISAKPRSSPGLWLAEAVATAGLFLVIVRAPRLPARPRSCWLNAPARSWDLA
jgi:hypothetical protein